MFRIFIRGVLILLFTMTVLGCAENYNQKETALDRNWGRSFESAIYLQTLNPEAEKDLKPVAGLPGPAEEKIMDRYISGEKGEKQTPSEFGILTTKQ